MFSVARPTGQCALACVLEFIPMRFRTPRSWPRYIAACVFGKLAACVAADHCAAFLLPPALVQHARRHGGGCRRQGEWRGEILNDLPDRVSDVLIFVGVAHSGLMHPILGYWAAIFAVLTAYVGLFGQAVGVQREFSGMMSKPWRMVALHVGAWTTFACFRWNDARFNLPSLTILDWTCLVDHRGLFANDDRPLAANHGRAAKESQSLMSPQIALHDPVFALTSSVVPISLLAAGWCSAFFDWA